jgi:GNAT superfamily N-acetyltransferase
MIRPAEYTDVPALVELGRIMHAESPVFSKLDFDAVKLYTTIGNVIEHGFACVYESNGHIRGVILAMICPHWFSRDLFSCDLALFIEPQHRGGIAAVRLLNAYAHWAMDSGAKLIQFGIMTGVGVETTAQLCERLGWKRAGVVMEYT